MSNYIILIVIGLVLLYRAIMPLIIRGRANAEVEQRREVLRQRIMRDPRNGAAYHELARSYNDEGKLLEARQVYQQLLPYVADIERFEVNKRLEDLERDIRMDRATRFRGFGVEAPKLSHVKFCAICGASNPKNAGRCWECDQLLDRFDNPLDKFHDRWQDARFRRNLTDAFVGIAVAVGLVRVCYDAPIELKIVAIVIAFIGICWQVALRISGR